MAKTKQNMMEMIKEKARQEILKKMQESK